MVSERREGAQGRSKRRGKDGDEDSDSSVEVHRSSKREKRTEKKKRRRDSDSDEESESSEDSEDVEDQREKKRKDRKKRHKEREEKRRTRKEERREKRWHGEDSEEKKKRKLMKEAKKFLKKGDRSKMVPVGASWDKLLPITVDEYFVKSVEFALWLKEERGTFFSSLTSEQSHELFTEFVEVWNAGQLSEKYYAGMEKAPRTSHNWGLALPPDATGTSGGVDPETQRMIDIAQDTLRRRQHRKEQEVVMEELVPKATGREAMMEKKAGRREEKRMRESSPEPVKEKDLMGGGDDFQTRLANQRAWREKKVAAKSNAMMEKQAEYQGRETAQMDEFKALISMAGGRITIPKRA